MKINVLVVQSAVKVGDVDFNIKRIDELFFEHQIESADLILFPELWTVGWDCVNFNKYSENIETSKTYEYLRKLALKYNSNVVGGSSIIKNGGGRDRNTCFVFDRSGNLKTTYDKFHLFSHRGQSEGTFLEEGDSPVIVNTDVGKIGLSICYDIRFPELFREYAYKGADIIVNMAAWPESFENEYSILAKARAIENQIYFISSALTGKINEEYNFSGNSMIIDFRGNVIASAKKEETILQAIIDTDTMEEYRKQMPILNDRKISYQTLEK